VAYSDNVCGSNGPRPHARSIPYCEFLLVDAGSIINVHAYVYVTCTFVFFYIQICWWTLHTTATCDQMRWVQFATTRRMIIDRGRQLGHRSFITGLNVRWDVTAHWSVLIVSAHAIHTRSVLFSYLPVSDFIFTLFCITMIMIRLLYLHIWVVPGPQNEIVTSIAKPTFL